MSFVCGLDSDDPHRCVAITGDRDGRPSGYRCRTLNTRYKAGVGMVCSNHFNPTWWVGQFVDAHRDEAMEARMARVRGDEL